MGKKNIETITLHISDVNDMINPFSPEGDGLLSDQYMALIDFYGKRVSDKKIELDFTENIGEQDRKNIRVAYYNSMVLFFSGIKKELKRLTGMALWFALSFVCSCLFMVIVGNKADGMAMLLGGILAYFFIVRLVIIVFSKIVPLLKKRKTIFSLNPLDIPAEKMASSKMYDELTVEGVLYVTTQVSGKKCIVRSTVIGDTNLITDSFASYLLKAMPFIENQKSMVLRILGLNISKEDQELTADAIRTFFSFRYDDTKDELDGGRKTLRTNVIIMIALFVVMYLLGFLGVFAITDIIITVVWILADCTLEMLFLSKNDLKERLKKYRLLRDMEVEFVDWMMYHSNDEIGV